MNTIICLLSLVILAQAVYIQALQRSPMGVLTPTALRLRLALYSVLRVRCFVVGLDIRKMKSLNTVLGYSNSNAIIGKFISGTRRYSDIVGQYGGDEFVICGRGNADKLVQRLYAMRDDINASLPNETREKLSIHTDGLIDGLHLAICTIHETDNAIFSAKRAIDATEPLKSGGRQTGNRDTSGRPGTLIVEL